MSNENVWLGCVCVYGEWDGSGVRGVRTAWSEEEEKKNENKRGLLESSDLCLRNENFESESTELLLNLLLGDLPHLKKR